MTRPTLTRPAQLALAALLAAATLAGCSDDDAGSAPAPAGPSSAAPSAAPSAGSAAATPTPAQTATCTDVEFGGERLGVTVPAGSALEPAEAAGGGGAQVELLARIQQAGSSAGEAPDAVVGVFGHTVAALPAPAALQASVAALSAVTGVERPARLDVTPTTIDGLPAETGGTGGTDPSAMRWWSLTSGDTGFVVVLSAQSRAVGTAYGEQVVGGLRAGGC